MGPDPLLATKCYIPPIRHGLSTPDVPSGLRARLVSRPRLIERLSAGIGRKLTLISAPAGFGMTTLVTDWLSLDEGDNNPARFFNYLLAPLQRHDPKSTVRWVTTCRV